MGSAPLATNNYISYQLLSSVVKQMIMDMSWMTDGETTMMSALIGIE